jgi:hypothetical protein
MRLEASPVRCFVIYYVLLRQCRNHLRVTFKHQHNGRFIPYHTLTTLIQPTLLYDETESKEF